MAIKVSVTTAHKGYIILINFVSRLPLLDYVRCTSYNILHML